MLRGGTGALQGAPPQKNVAVQKQAVPGSGKGIVIGYATSLEAVPIVHVISNGIKAQAKRAGVKLIFCDTGGDTAKALDCAKSMKTQGAQGILQFQHVAKASPAICKAGPQGVPVFAIDIPQPPCQTSFMGVDNAYGGFVAGEKAGETARRSGTASTTPGSRWKSPKSVLRTSSAWVATARASSRSAPARSRT